MSINAQTNAGDTPVHLGLRGAMKFDTLQIFLRGGASVHIRNKKGRSVLHEAAKYSGIGIKAIELLIKYGASVNALDDEGSSVLHDVLSNPVLTTEMLHLLLRHGAVPDCRNSMNKPPLAYVPKSHLSDQDKEYATKLLIQYTVLKKFNGSRSARNGLMENDEILPLNFCQDPQRHDELVRIRNQCISEVRQMNEYILEDNFSLFNFMYQHYNNLMNLKDMDELVIERLIKWLVMNKCSSFIDEVIICLENCNFDNFVSKLFS